MGRPTLPRPPLCIFPRPLTILHLLAKAGAPPHANLLFAKSESGQQEEGGRRHVKGVPFFSLPPPLCLLQCTLDLPRNSRNVAKEEEEEESGEESGHQKGRENGK